MVMADCGPATIHIGGDISEDAIREIFEPLEGWDDFDVVPGEYVRIYQYAAEWGRFSEEGELMRRGIPFDRFSDAHLDLEAAHAWFRPLGGTSEFKATTAMVKKSDLRELYDNCDCDESFSVEVLNLLGPEPPPLPPWTGEPLPDGA